MLIHNIDYFKTKPVELPKTTILLDNGYHLEKLTQALAEIYPEIMTKIQCWAGDPPRFELSAKPSKAEKEAKGQSGFVPVAARWVIERSNAWVERCKSLVKNFDRTLERSNAKLKLCFIRLMLKRLAAPAIAGAANDENVRVAIFLVWAEPGSGGRDPQTPRSGAERRPSNSPFRWMACG